MASDFAKAKEGKSSRAHAARTARPPKQGARKRPPFPPPSNPNPQRPASPARLALVHLGVAQALLHRVHALAEQVHAQLLEAGTRDGRVEVDACWRGLAVVGGFRGRGFGGFWGVGGFGVVEGCKDGVWMVQERGFEEE